MLSPIILSLPARGRPGAKLRDISMKKILALLLTASTCLPAIAAAPGDWASYGRDLSADRYSPLTDITPANVANLKVAWTYHLRAQGVAANPRASSEVTPLVVGGILYTPTMDGRVVALDGATGTQLWSTQLPAGTGNAALRGIQYWPGAGKAGPELLVPTSMGKLVVLSPKTGALISAFGDGGVMDLKTPDVMNSIPTAQYSISSPPAFYKNIVITGSRVQESPAQGASGDVRAFDAVTGDLLWTFHTIPQPGEKGHDSWEGDSWKARSGVNVWGQISVDEKRGIAYLPIAAPTYDRFGGDRKGDNLFADALVAVNARTGKYLWHYQIIHHDIFDFDLPAPPALIDVKKNGKVIPAVVAINKAAIMFILNRVTGKPIYDVTETPVPASTTAGEAASPTQPIPVKPPQLARNSFKESDVADLTPDLKAFCQNAFTTQHAHESERYSPLTQDAPIVRFPGSGGGVNWGGGAFDPKLGYYIINTSDMGSIEQLTLKTGGVWGTLPGGDSFWLDPTSKMMCQTPPWGSLTAVNVNNGDIAWRVNLGVTDSLPEGQRNTGRPNLGGPIVTASGLTFIGATDDSRFRAFDSRTGKELWTYRLDFSAHATPITYKGKDGKQYVAVMSTGGTYLRSPGGGDLLMVFALP
jgi:quinoprotein glucose dehydrogenase